MAAGAPSSLFAFLQVLQEKNKISMDLEKLKKLRQSYPSDENPQQMTDDQIKEIAEEFNLIQDEYTFDMIRESLKVNLYCFLILILKHN